MADGLGVVSVLDLPAERGHRRRRHWLEDPGNRPRTLNGSVPGGI